MSHPETRLERREVLRAGALVFATIALSGCASLFAKKRDADVTVTPSQGEARVPLSAAPWLRGGQGTLAVAVTGSDDKILLFREPGGSLVALNMTCTHRGCDVGFDADRGHVVCPCHGSEYTNAGAVLRGPAERPLASYPVRVEGDDVVIRIG